MFRTVEDGRIQSPIDSLEPGGSKWSYLFIDTPAPILLVTTRVTESEGDVWYQSLLLKNARQLQAAGNQDNIDICWVQLVRPYCQEAHGWELDDVEEVNIGFKRCESGSIEISDVLTEYQLFGGKRIVYPNENNSNEAPIEFMRAFSLPDQ